MPTTAAPWNQYRQTEGTWHGTPDTLHVFLGLYTRFATVRDAVVRSMRRDATLAVVMLRAAANRFVPIAGLCVGRCAHRGGRFAVDSVNARQVRRWSRWGVRGRLL